MGFISYPFVSLCSAEYSYTGAGSFSKAHHQQSKTVNRLHKEPAGEPSRQFGRNAYVWRQTYFYMDIIIRVCAHQNSPVKAKGMNSVPGNNHSCISLHIPLSLKCPDSSWVMAQCWDISINDCISNIRPFFSGQEMWFGTVQTLRPPSTSWSFVLHT